MHAKIAAKLQAAGRKGTDCDLEILSLVKNTRELPRGATVLRDGSRPDRLTVVLNGWAIRSKKLPNGSRQSLGVLLPGDFANAEIVSPGQLDHDVLAATALHIADVDGAALRAMLSASPENDLAFWRLGLVEQAIQRCWITSLGRRDALERVAHLICELHVRLGWIGEASNRVIKLPLTQQALADLVGLTAVHTNRVLQQLRGDGLIKLKGGQLQMTGDLERVTGFDPGYLLNPLSAVRPY